MIETIFTFTVIIFTGEISKWSIGLYGVTTKFTSCGFISNFAKVEERC